MNIRLNNGHTMPMLGLGVFKATQEGEAMRAVTYALTHGYRLIDTAAAYQNEEGVGQGIKESGVPRKEIFVTTKVWNDAQRNNDVLGAFERSLDKLDMEYVDLYLLHWPVKESFHKSWEDLQKIYESGRTKAIGVSNFLPHHLDSLLESTTLIPAVNQFECHPLYNQAELIRYCKEKGIVAQAHTPLLRGALTDSPILKEIGEKYRKTPAQVALRWSLQNGVSAIPKSVTPSRIDENFNIFDFELSDEDMKQIFTMTGTKRYCSDPDNFNF